MQEISIVLGILGALLIGAASPGPSFVLVARLSVAQSRQHGLAAALGMGSGGFIFGSFALFGIHTLITEYNEVYQMLIVLGGGYLLYLGFRLFKGAVVPLDDQQGEAVKKDNLFHTSLTAMLVQISNPKTMIVYGSVFAAFLPADTPFYIFLVIPPLVFGVEFLWYAIVALLFSAGSRREFYLGSKKWIDRIAGLVIGGLGVKIVIQFLF